MNPENIVGIYHDLVTQRVRELPAAERAARRRGRERLISRDGSRLAAHVVPTNEELLIARDMMRTTGEVPQWF